MGLLVNSINMTRFKGFLDYILITLLLILLFFIQNESIPKQVYSIFGVFVIINFFYKLVNSKNSKLIIFSSIFTSIVISFSILDQFVNFEIINLIINILGFINIIYIIFLFKKQSQDLDMLT